MASKLAAALAAVGAAALTGCSAPTPATHDALQVVASTPLIADIVGNVAGERADVTSLIPVGMDPHVAEPSLRTVRSVAYADAIFYNGLLLEPDALTSTLHESAAPDTPVVPLAEESTAYGARQIPLVENVNLDAVWLGMRSGVEPGEDPTALMLHDVHGPGDVAAFITGTFGTPEVVFDSADGINKRDSIVLPAGAHTHVSWAFSQPGVYALDVGAPDEEPATVTVAVGVPPQDAAKERVVDHGHVDISVGQGRPTLLVGDGAETETVRSEDAVIAVPASVLQEIPADPTYRFLGKPGEQTYLLPQAVLGKHVHGEIDPHLWHDADNVIAYVQVIENQLAAIDPEGAAEYAHNARKYVGRLKGVDKRMQAAVDSIPPAQRTLVTTHDGYNYLAEAYGLKIGAVISPNPAIEPSPQDLITVRAALDNLRVPAVFIEPELAGRSTPLSEIARGAGVGICQIHGDTFTPHVNSYIELMDANAEELSRCLGQHTTEEKRPQ
ncbi:anchored repeat ABC transporter, substrate-binding protein [Corynebacterium renale]|uniref:Anchored repeat ABC transporter substrate-binding protein n=1 Tax=Corynebacterium renale TaxID=1724 RepID=A0A2A9DLL1_9CORY|nr:anchored repeat ABC transporter, substrate-binding protein [Corynebacterium renale]PFG27261.1 anchored repeat ABC transporter substrate-binding protein [Corynebacterium renale]SQI23653.1 ABC transporter substrate-binding protein [Corynebacterium renale]